jgi:hypothetical protein
MSLQAPFEGGCQCGAIRFRCTAAPLVEFCCHCRICQRITSAPMMALALVPTNAVAITRGTPAEYRSTENGIRQFCPTCGTALLFRRPTRPDFRVIPVGAIDDAEAFRPTAHIWTSRDLPWVRNPGESVAFAEHFPA